MWGSNNDFNIQISGFDNSFTTRKDDANVIQRICKMDTKVLGKPGMTHLLAGLCINWALMSFPSITSLYIYDISCDITVTSQWARWRL